MNLPPDKMKLLSQYDNEKKWELVCDQERFQVKNPPSAYLLKIKSFLDQGVVSRKFKRRVQESTQVLRELEISLRTNHIGWAQEFLNEENKGLDVLVEYLSFAQCSVTYDMESVDNGGPTVDRGKNLERSVEDLTRSAGNSPTHGASKASRHLTVRFNSLHSRKALRNSRIVSQKDDVHVCIMCLRAIMNYQSGFNLVMTHPRCVNEITLSLNNKNPRTKALVLELLAAVCLVRGGHDIILTAFDNFKEWRSAVPRQGRFQTQIRDEQVCGEKNRFEKLMEYFRNEDSNIDFMVACMQFINIVVHSVENMNFRVHLQYEFTHHGLDEYLEKLKHTESDKLLVQIQAYLDNVFDVGALLEDAETKNALLEHMEELHEFNAQLSTKMRESEDEAMEKVAELQKQLIQAMKEVKMLKMNKIPPNKQDTTFIKLFSSVLMYVSSNMLSSLRKFGLKWAIQMRIIISRKAESLQESSSLISTLRQKEQDRERTAQATSELEIKVQELQDKGLIRVARSSSGSLDIQVIPITIIEMAPTPQTGPVAQTDVVDKETPQTPSVTPPAPPPPPPPLFLGGLPVTDKDPNHLSPVLSDQQRSGAHPVVSILITSLFNTGCKAKKPIKTKFRMPLLNWVALKPNQVSGTVFNEIDDEHVLGDLNMEIFEEQFKTKAQGPPVDLGTLKMKVVQKAPSKVSLIESNRAKNLAITLRKGGMSAPDICTAIETYNLQSLSLDFLELLERFIPTDYELKLIRNYEKDGKPLDELSEEDRFMMRFSKIPRLAERLSTLTFMGNFPDTVQLLKPQLNAIIAASMSIKSSTKLKKILEIILAFGNYMNSSKKGAAYGFRLQSLDMLLDTKSTDRKQTLLHYIVGIIQEKYPDLSSFHTELRFVDKAAAVSLDSILQDLRTLQKGMEVTRKEFMVQDDNAVLKEFLKNNNEVLDSLQADGRTAQEAYDSVVEYFGENSKTTPPSMFFPMFVRFIKAYRQADQENEQRKKQEALASEGGEKPGTPTKTEQAGQKQPPMMKLPQMDLIAELKKRQTKPLVREGKDGAIEDIITDLRNQPYRRTDGGRRSAKKRTNGQQLQVSSDISL
ncbi:FMNL1 protein, partial [Atractosteus spatula]|nr:FMNL1 protein [Atractosteus spatula]